MGAAPRGESSVGAWLAHEPDPSRHKAVGTEYETAQMLDGDLCLQLQNTHLIRAKAFRELSAEVEI